MLPDTGKNNAHPLKIGLVATAFISLAVAGCQTTGDTAQSEEATGGEQTAVASGPRTTLISTAGEMAPAPLPSYRIGDSFTYDNPMETWRITGFDERGRLIWQSSLNAERITSLDPMLPSLRHVAADGRGVTRIINRGAELFPLSEGKTAAFSEAAGMDEPPYSQSFEWTCSVTGEGQATVPAGSFDSYRVDCSRSDGLLVESLYAPAIGHVIKRTITNGDQTQVRSLVATTKGEGSGTAPLTLASGTGGTTPPQAAAQTPTPVPAPAPAPQQAAVPADGLYVQLASFGNEAAARSGWGKLTGSHGAALSGLQPAIKPVTIPGRGTFYRLYAGPVSRNQADQLCQQLPNLSGWCNAERLR